MPHYRHFIGLLVQNMHPMGHLVEGTLTYVHTAKINTIDVCLCTYSAGGCVHLVVRSSLYSPHFTDLCTCLECLHFTDLCTCLECLHFTDLCTCLECLHFTDLCTCLECLHFTDLCTCLECLHFTDLCTCFECLLVASHTAGTS